MLLYFSDITPLSFLLILFFNINLSLAISCKDENNKDVDWFIIYKLPRINGEESGSPLQTGSAYAYITSNGPAEWKLSSNEIGSPDSMLGRTYDYFEKKKDRPLSYLFYNDDSPKRKSTAIGHLKGIVVFDTKSGYWLTHSIPRFPSLKKYEFPNNALTNGQMALCVNFNTSWLKDIYEHLLYCNPNIYESKMDKGFKKYLDENSGSLHSERPNFIRNAPLTRESKMTSLNNTEFHVFAKDNKLRKDIYSDIIAPSLETSLVAETWRRGAGTFMDPSCESNYTVTDVVSVDMKVPDRKEGISFKSTEDHSKWAISVDEADSWVCVGDLNRMESQMRRGGGAICFKSKPVWKAFNSIIDETSECES